MKNVPEGHFFISVDLKCENPSSLYAFGQLFKSPWVRRNILTLLGRECFLVRFDKVSKCGRRKSEEVSTSIFRIKEGSTFPIESNKKRKRGVIRMSIHLVLTDTILESMAKEVEKRMGITTIRVKEFIEKTTPEELIVRGVVASLKTPEKVIAGRR